MVEIVDVEVITNGYSVREREGIINLEMQIKIKIKK